MNLSWIDYSLAGIIILLLGAVFRSLISNAVDDAYPFIRSGVMHISSSSYAKLQKFWDTEETEVSEQNSSQKESENDSEGKERGGVNLNEVAKEIGERNQSNRKDWKR